MTSHDPYDPIQEETKAAEVALRNERLLKTEVENIKWVMSNRRGRQFIYQLLESAGVFQISFDTNALAMAFKEGRRNEGLRVFSMLQAHCPARYNEMIKESKEWPTR